MKIPVKNTAKKIKFQDKIKSIFNGKNTSSRKIKLILSSKELEDKQRDLIENWSEWYTESPID